jgi:hypothetical protein
MMNYLVAAIHKLKPTAQFAFKEDDYSTIEWIDLEGDAPTPAEIEQTIKEIKAEEKTAAKALESQKQAVLDKLGLTPEEAAALFA